MFSTVFLFWAFNFLKKQIIRHNYRTFFPNLHSLIKKNAFFTKFFLNFKETIAKIT